MLKKTDKIIFRKIRIIEILDASEKGIKVSSLADILNLSLKTVKKELNELEFFLKKNVNDVRILKVNNIYKLSKLNPICRDLIYLFLKKESVYFFLVRKSFFGNISKQNNDNANEYYSYSNMYKYKHLFKIYLKQFDLDLNIRKLSVEGSETRKRFYYFNFFWENYRGMEWPFDNINREILMMKIENPDNDFSYNMSEIEREQFLYWIAIIKIRTNSGFFFQNHKTEDRSKRNNYIFKNSLELYNLMRNLLPEIEENQLKVEANFLYYFFSFTTESSISKSHILCELCETSDEFNVAKFTEGTITKFISTFKITRKNFTDIHFSIYKLLVYELYCPTLAKKEALKYVRNHIYFGMFEYNFQIFYKDFIIRWGKKDSEYLYNGLLFLFSNLIELNEYRPSINLILVSSLGPVYKEILMNKIYNLTNNIVINEENSGKTNIIISDCMINKTGEFEVFYWNQNPTEKDWKLLKKKLDELERIVK